MTALASYSTGTVSVGVAGVTVTGVGTIWSGVNARPGDVLVIGNFATIIADVTDPTHLVIPPWGGGAQAGAAYKIYQVSPQRFAGAQAQADVSAAVAAWASLGYFVFVDPALAVPDPSIGSNGQYALQPTTRKFWLKTAGVWVFQGQPGIGDLVAANNLSDVADKPTARANLGIKQTLSRGYIYGLTVSTVGGSTTISIAAGEAIDSTNTDLISLPAPITKILANWVAGSGNGCIATGSVSSSLLYAVYLIKRPDTGAVDVFAPAIANGLTELPLIAGGAYTLARRIGYWKSDGALKWEKVIQDGDRFVRDVPVTDVNGALASNNAILRALSVPPSTIALFHARVYSTVASATATLFTDPATTDTVPDFTNSQQIGNAALSPFAQLQVRTDASGRVRQRTTQASGVPSDCTVVIGTEGWIDTRGRFA